MTKEQWEKYLNSNDNKVAGKPAKIIEHEGREGVYVLNGLTYQLHEEIEAPDPDEFQPTDQMKLVENLVNLMSCLGNADFRKNYETAIKLSGGKVEPIKHDVSWEVRAKLIELIDKLKDKSIVDIENLKQ